jgi:transcription initiation factor TFIIB
MPCSPDGHLLSPGEVYEDDQAGKREWKQDLNILLICPDCDENPPNLVEEFAAGDTVCGSCGRVLAEHTLDTRSEWRNFSNDNEEHGDPSRVGDGGNPLLQGSQLYTSIAGEDNKGQNSLNLLRAQQQTSLHKQNKKFQHVFAQIDNFCEIGSINKTTADTAKHFYTKVMKAEVKLVKNKQLETIASCILLAGRQGAEGSSRSIKEVVKMTGLKSKNGMNKVFTNIQVFLKDENRKGANQARVASNGAVLSGAPVVTSITNKASEISSLVIRFAPRLQISRSTCMIAEEIARKVTSDGITSLAGRNPFSVAGAVIYFACHLMLQARTAQHIGHILGISSRTIQLVYDRIYPQRNEIFVEAWLARGANMANLPVPRNSDED